MAPRNKGNRGHNTRSNQHNKEGGQGSASAAPDAPHKHPQAAASKSPAHNVQLPPGKNKQNKPVAGTVSKQQPNVHSNVNINENTPCNPIDPPENVDQGLNNIESSLPVSGHDLDSSGHANFPKVGDNGGVHDQTLQDSLAGLEGVAVAALTSELRAIRSRMDTLDKIETSIATLVDQCGGLSERTGKVEAKAEANSSKLLEVSAEIATLRETVELQGRAIVKLTNIKSELLNQNKEVKADLVKQNKGITKEMNQLIEQQKEQVGSFLSTSKRIENNICERVEKKLSEQVNQKMEEKMEEKADQASQEASFQSLKDQAYAKRHNLIITGLEEDDNKDILSVVKDFLKTLGAGNYEIHEAYRIGSRQGGSTSYRRPVVVVFVHLAERNKVWRKRSKVTSDDGEQKVRIQADLPKRLREEINILYRVTRAAANTQEYQNAVVRSYAIQLNGKEFSPGNLERLPYSIRPSTISNPRSDAAIAFFSKYSVLSNHHPSPFKLAGESFQNMEHYLAVQRAKLSGQEPILQRARAAVDPIEAKAILRSLREDHPQEWTEKVQGIATDGLRAKFTQNDHLLSFLKSTNHLQIGEASTNPRWGIGLELRDPDVLDVTKWSTEGNLLGKCLMEIRKELSEPEN